jgi:hypothetical protein
MSNGSYPEGILPVRTLANVSNQFITEQAHTTLAYAQVQQHSVQGMNVQLQNNMQSNNYSGSYSQYAPQANQIGFGSVVLSDYSTNYHKSNPPSMNLVAVERNNTTQTINSGNAHREQGSSNSIPCWRMMFDLSFSAENLLQNIDNIVRESLVSFLNAFVDNLGKGKYSKSVTNHIRSLRLHIFKTLLERIGYTNNKTLLPRERTVKEMVEDIYTICTCIVEGSIQPDLLNVFNSKKDDDSSLYDVINALQEQNKNVNNVVTSLAANVKLLTRQMTDLINNNSELSEKIEKMKSELCQRNVSASLISDKIHTSKKRKTDESEEDANIDSNDNQRFSEISGSILKSKITERSQVQSSIINKTPAQVNFTPCIAKQKDKVHEPITNSTSNQTKKSNDPNKTKWSSIAASCPKNSKFVKNNSNGQTFLDVAKRSSSNDKQIESWKVVTGRRKSKVVGNVISSIKELSAASKPYYFYTSNWSLESNTDVIGKYISGFAKLLNIEELCTSKKQRRFKSFKVAVESYSYNAMMCESNWPGNILIAKWNFSLKGKSKNKPNVITTSNKTNDDVLKVPATSKKLKKASPIKGAESSTSTNEVEQDPDKSIIETNETEQMEQSDNQVEHDSATRNDSHATESVHNGTTLKN